MWWFGFAMASALTGECCKPPHHVVDFASIRHWRMRRAGTRRRARSRKNCPAALTSIAGAPGPWPSSRRRWTGSDRADRQRMHRARPTACAVCDGQTPRQAPLPARSSRRAFAVPSRANVAARTGPRPDPHGAGRWSWCRRSFSTAAISAGPPASAPTR